MNDVTVGSLATPQGLLDELLNLRRDICDEGDALFTKWQPTIKRRAFVLGARNLAMYLAMRRRDLRMFQDALPPYGLSSLGRSEGRVLENLDAVIAALTAICEPAIAHQRPFPTQHAFYRGERMLEHNTEQLFGPEPENRHVRILVTMPSEAAHDLVSIRDLMKRGMDLARINAAHDDPDTWKAMIANIRKAEAEIGRTCPVLIDLAGPKTRTGQVSAPDGERLKLDDQLFLTRGKIDDPVPNAAEKIDFRAECGIPEIFDQLKLGDSVWIDEGRIGTQVEALLPEGAILRVTRVRQKGQKLKPEKGLNFPDTELKLSPLTDKDYADLDFIAEHADMVGYSFVQSASDVQLLQTELNKRTARPIPIVAKIETAKAVRNLPDIIVQGASLHPLSVMIARGDLAVEIGYQRMAEMQEEILWICEAAHIPVIWATQVLEGFTKDSIPTRAEMTDAAMSERAECVMLNKGEYMAEAVSVLSYILVRMQGHQLKKTPRLRALRSWQRLSG